MAAPEPHRLRNLGIVLSCVVLALLGLWLGAGDATPAFGGVPSKLVKCGAAIYLILEALPAIGVAWLGAVGLGWPLRWWLLRDGRGAMITQVALGMAVLLIGWWLLAWGVGFAPWIAWGLPGIGCVAAVLQWFLASRAADVKLPVARPDLSWTLLLAMPALGALLVVCTVPPGALWRVEAYGYDVMSYHLQIPREWLAAGAMTPLRHNVYSFLPGLIECAYAQLGVMRGGIENAVYTTQLFHASLGIFAALAVGGAVAEVASGRAGIIAGAALLSTPWVFVTGSLAYNEMAVLAFGGAAVLVLLDIRSETWRGAVAIGVLVGAATLAKPTAGMLVAVPVGVVLLTRLNHAVRWRQPPEMRKAVLAASVAAATGLVTLSPYLVRNYTWTGNPVFPFATGTFGTGHWDQALADRWAAGHGLKLASEAAPTAPDSPPPDSRLQSLDRQWLRNAGYGAIGGGETPQEIRNIARFTREGGWPILWTAVALLGVLTVRQLRVRRAVGAMLLILALQLLFWLFATHLQSRFLIPTLLPACVILGLGYHRLIAAEDSRVARVAPFAAAALVVAMQAVTLGVIGTQTRLLPARGGSAHAPVYFWIDASDVGQHALDQLQPDSRTFLVADNMGLFYIDTPVEYHSAFDANPLGQIIRDTGGDREKVTAALRERGITHVWAHWSELNRLHSTYGFDPDVTEPTLRDLARRWRRIVDSPTVTLYMVR